MTEKIAAIRQRMGALAAFGFPSEPVSKVSDLDIPGPYGQIPVMRWRSGVMASVLMDNSCLRGPRASFQRTEGSAPHATSNSRFNSLYRWLDARLNRYVAKMC